MRAPSPELSPWIAHYWMIAWDLADGESQLAESVPHPNIHLVGLTPKQYASIVDSASNDLTRTDGARVTPR